MRVLELFEEARLAQVIRAVDAPTGESDYHRVRVEALDDVTLERTPPGSIITVDVRGQTIGFAYNDNERRWFDDEGHRLPTPGAVRRRLEKYSRVPRPVSIWLMLPKALQAA